MKAVVFHGVGDIRLDDVPEPKLQESHDAIIDITASAICGTDLHFVRGTMRGMQSGTILGHEAVGVIAEIGKDVRNLRPGDRVVVASTIACGYCAYCRDGYFSQCDHANPNGQSAGTAFFGGPKASGRFDGLQAERARIPFANVGLTKLPEGLTDEQAILLSDIFPTGYFAAELAEVLPGDTVAVFGCGPVGQFAILSAFLLGAGRVLAVDNVPSRLEAARALGAEVIDFDADQPVEVLQQLTGGIGPDRVIDAVGIDAESPKNGDAGLRGDGAVDRMERARSQVAPDVESRDEQWKPGDAPMQALIWAVDAIAKAGTLAIVGVYPPQFESFPFGKAFGKNLTINVGNCNHRQYIPKLVRMVAAGEVDPTLVLTRQEQLVSAIEAYKSFDRRETGWLKVELIPEHQPERIDSWRHDEAHPPAAGSRPAVVGAGHQSSAP
jgi:threonine dehydrogenase-like Zn-dependent dehydrogenase